MGLYAAPEEVVVVILRLWKWEDPTSIKILSTRHRGKTLAHICVEENYWRLLWHLVNWKVDMGVKDDDGLTVLERAANMKHMIASQIVREEQSIIGSIPFNSKIFGSNSKSVIGQSLSYDLS